MILGTYYVAYIHNLDGKSTVKHTTLPLALSPTVAVNLQMHVFWQQFLHLVGGLR